MITIYARGVCFLSVCAPAELSAAEVEAAVNREEPTGIDSPWTVSAEKWRHGGHKVDDANPRECEQDRGRRHWLLSC